MLSDVDDKTIPEVLAHIEQWSFVNGGAEVCPISSVNLLFRPHYIQIVCLRPVKGRYVTVTVGGDRNDFQDFAMKLYSKCK